MFQRGLTPPDPFPETDVLERARTQDAMSLQAMAALGRVLVVLLPALDRAAAWLEAVREARARLEERGYRLVLVHMAPDEEARAAFGRYALQYLARISDPGRALYRHFGLGEASRLLGPPRQLPGLIWLEGGEIAHAERPRWDQKAPLRLIGPRGPN